MTNGGIYKTKKAREWAYLKRYGSITTRDAYLWFGHMRLPDYIHKWRKKGIEITDRREKNDLGEHWKRYFITPEEAERAEKEHLVCL